MHVIIDGYNLLFAVDRLRPKSPPSALEPARRWLMRQLRERHSPETRITVVFDSRQPTARPRDDQFGIKVCFAQRESADDLIEELIQSATVPAKMMVVSNDNRIREAARRRGCVVLGCLEYYQPEGKTPKIAPSQQTSSKPEMVSPEEVEELLREFGQPSDGQAP